MSGILAANICTLYFNYLCHIPCSFAGFYIVKQYLRRIFKWNISMEYLHWIFHLNISAEYLHGILLIPYSYGNIISLQQHFELDSFIQYVGRLPSLPSSSRRGCSSVRGHYIGFCKIGAQWFRFDNAVVHRVTLLHSYCINLTIYRRRDTPGYDTSTDLTIIPELQKSVILNRHNSQSNNITEDPKSSNSSKPPIISGNDPDLAPHPEPPKTPAIKPERPTRSQPYRSKKEYVVYYGMDSQSSSDEGKPDRTHPDEEYVPPSNKGMK